MLSNHAKEVIDEMLMTNAKELNQTNLTYNDKVVPDAEQFPHVNRTWLMLHRLCE